MDSQPTTLNLRVDQAVFTSLRSATGEGYRLIAASPTVSGIERTEIIRRCPSHGGLDSSLPTGRGLSSYPLSSGRHCVAYSGYAGVEPSGRGGERVYTHLAILDRESFARVGFDPVPIHEALRQTVGVAPVLTSESRLGPLGLQIPTAEFTVPRRFCPACRITRAVLSHPPVMVVGCSDPLVTLRWILAAMPPAARPTLSVTVGLKFTFSRLMHLAFLGSGAGETKRMIRGHDVQWIDVGDFPAESRRRAS